MTWPQAILVYAVCWWMLLFMALPFGIRSRADGTPQKTYLAVKCGVVSLLALAATLAIDILLHSGIVSVK